jgi:hypothetical protein
MAIGHAELRLLNKVMDAHFQNPEKYIVNLNVKASRFRVFKYFVQYCLYRNLANFDSLILITGEKGSGKSSFAIMLAREWCRLLGIMFDSDKHIAYSNRQVQEKIDKLDKFQPLICDEAINFATSEAWNLKSNKELKKKLGQVRTKHLFYILCFPLKIMKVDKVYLDSYVNYWIDLIGRGRGALFVKDKNPVHDSWRLKDFRDLGAYTEFTSMDKVQKKLMKHPNFWYIITSPKPSARVYNKYLVVREQNIYNDMNTLNIVSRQDIYRALLLKVLEDIMVRDSTITLKRLILHIKVEYDFEIKEKDLRLVLDDANQLLDKIKEERRKDVEFEEEKNA